MLKTSSSVTSTMDKPETPATWTGERRQRRALWAASRPFPPSSLSTHVVLTSFSHSSGSSPPPSPLHRPSRPPPPSPPPRRRRPETPREQCSARYSREAARGAEEEARGLLAAAAAASQAWGWAPGREERRTWWRGKGPPGRWGPPESRGTAMRRASRGSRPAAGGAIGGGRRTGQFEQPTCTVKAHLKNFVVWLFPWGRTRCPLSWTGVVCGRSVSLIRWGPHVSGPYFSDVCQRSLILSPHLPYVFAINLLTNLLIDFIGKGLYILNFVLVSSYHVSQWVYIDFL